MPVLVNTGELPVLLRPRRDFGITAAIVAAIAASAAAATAAAIALTTSVQTAAALNNVTGQLAEALATQEQINGHLHAGILIVNQRVDLLQEQMDILEGLLVVGCISNMKGICVTPVEYPNFTRAANISKELGKMLNGPWSAKFHNLTRLLRSQIVSLNATKVSLASVGDWVKFFQSSLSFLKEWAGIGVFCALMVGASIFMLRYLCRLGHQQRHQ
ncbi:uncharacterized protein LOC116583488 [Mustela erminea]|uniref:uncharacterized protein LOC116583488 n=1 Tax=Mustela erminea TaxID=36723 RepID=UPI001387313D|nr:uncharacterized protein LOC116583488 [Mustela erminea]